METNNIEIEKIQGPFDLFIEIMTLAVKYC